MPRKTNAKLDLVVEAGQVSYAEIKAGESIQQAYCNNALKATTSLHSELTESVRDLQQDRGGDFGGNYHL